MRTSIFGRFADNPRRNNIKKHDGTEVSRCFITVLEDNGKDANGEAKKPTPYNVTVNGKLADVFMQHCAKGDSMYIEAEYAPYYAKPRSKSTNQPIEDAYDVLVPSFRLTSFKFGQKSSHHAENLAANASSGVNAHSDLPSYNQNDFTNEPILDGGDIPFNMDGNDPFQLGGMA